MATIGLDKLFYAPITEDENGDEEYGTPVMLAKAIWRLISCPPYTGSTFTPCIYFASFLISSATWMASSLVGERMITCVL